MQDSWSVAIRIAEVQTLFLLEMSSNTPMISCASPSQNGWKALSGAGVPKRLRMTIRLALAVGGVDAIAWANQAHWPGQSPAGATPSISLKR
jgi:hypothetical protein